MWIVLIFILKTISKNPASTVGFFHSYFLKFTPSPSSFVIIFLKSSKWIRI